MAPLVTGRRTPPGPDPVSDEDGFRFHALLSPNRSLSADGFRRVLAVVIGVNLINGLIYLTLGAWPVAFFCGIDILLVWVAFKISYAQGKRFERVMLTDEALWVSRVMPSGHESRWKLSPHWARVEIDRPVEHESQLKVTERGQTLILGSFLSPEERGEFAEALQRALAEAKAA
jgi:uncharacterized membrane protein